MKAKQTTKKLNDLIGKEVVIYPGDTYKKTGIIQEISQIGILFLITSYEGKDRQYVVNKLHFIGFGSNCTFREVVRTPFDEKY